jgi:NAD(P)-dependent dehydrogenase (short-subunit alcohol dehydrogenase family)
MPTRRSGRRPPCSASNGDENNMTLLNNKIAVVTGGSSGIGLATAKRFAKEGAHVFVAGRRQVELDKAVTEIGKNATAVQADISKLDDLDRLYEIVAKKGKIDVIFAAAAFVEKVMTVAVTTSSISTSCAPRAAGRSPALPGSSWASSFDVPTTSRWWPSSSSRRCSWSRAPRRSPPLLQAASAYLLRRWPSVSPLTRASTSPPSGVRARTVAS